MSYLTDPLWHRIVAYNPDDPRADFPFSKKLANQQNWSHAFTQRAIEEYKKFIYLCCISPQGASPSKVVDEVWHLHLTYTVEYWTRFCKEILDKEIHHHPSAGGTTETVRHADWYQNTLQQYIEVFGLIPPSDIWNDQKVQITSLPAVIETPISATDMPESTQHRDYIFYLVLLIPALISWGLYGKIIPYALAGKQFLIFYMLLCVAGFALTFVTIARRKKQLTTTLLQHTKDSTVHDLAYFSGGSERMFLSILAELLTEKTIRHYERETYIIDKQAAAASRSLIAADLTERNEITYEELHSICFKHLRVIETKYERLKTSFDHSIANFNAPLIILIVGLARCVQGAMNHKPFGYLAAMMIGFTIISFIIVRQFRFHKVCRDLLRDDARFMEQVKEGHERDIIFNGLPALMAIPLFFHLGGRLMEHERLSNTYNDSDWGNDTWNNDNHHGSSGSSCSSDGGSSCGSSCSSGCGGCGGGD